MLLCYRNTTTESYTDQFVLPMWRHSLTMTRAHFGKTLMPFWHILCLPQPDLTLPRSKPCWRASPLQGKEVARLVARLVAGRPPDCAIFSLSHLRITRGTQPQHSQKPLDLKVISKLHITYQEHGSTEKGKMESPEVHIIQLEMSRCTFFFKTDNFDKFLRL